MFGKNINFALLNKMLDITALRSRVIANNLANVDTPGFKKCEVSFEAALEEAVHSRQPQQIDAVEVEVVQSTEGPVRQDGNNVDVDKELSELAKNTLAYNTFAQFLSSQFIAMKEAITGGRH